MRALRDYGPDLRACELEDRLLPVTPNLGAIVLTTCGYALLLNPFGASSSPTFLTPSVMTGSLGSPGVQPGNGTGAPGPATTAPTGSNGGAAVTIIVGSGADDAGAPIIPPVTLNSIANDAVNAAAVIGRASGDRSDVLPPGQVYRDGVPVTGPAGASTKAPGQPTGSEPGERPADPMRIRLRRPPHRPTDKDRSS
jgi:hypothetical protein